MLQIRLETRQFENALRQLHHATNKLPHQILNRAIWSASIHASKMMPVTNAAKIDAQLGTVRVRNERGKILRSKKRQILGGIAPGKERPLESLAKLIFLARANKAGLNRGRGAGGVSNFNVTTNNRYAVGAFTNKGIPMAVSRMIKTRHSGGGFYRLCALAVQLIFGNSDRGLNNPAFITAPGEDGQALAGGGRVSRRIGVIAGGSVAQLGSGRAKASFWVTGTRADSKDALERIAKPVWDSAMGREASFMQDKAWKAYSTALRSQGYDVR